jgi:hypothetical protein
MQLTLKEYNGVIHVLKVGVVYVFDINRWLVSNVGKSNFEAKIAYLEFIQKYGLEIVITENIITEKGLHIDLLQEIRKNCVEKVVESFDN